MVMIMMLMIMMPVIIITMAKLAKWNQVFANSIASSNVACLRVIVVVIVVIIET